MPKSSKPSAGSEVKDLIDSMGWAFKLTWSIDKVIFPGVVATGVIRSLIPAGLALVGRGLINAVTDIINHNGSSIRPTLFWLIAGLILTVLSMVVAAIFQYLSRRLKDELDLRIVSDILQHASSLDYATLEDPRFHDTIQQARENAALNFSQFITNSITVISNCLTSFSLFVILSVIAPLLVVILTPIGACYLFFQWVLGLKGFQMEQSRVTKYRWAYYYLRKLIEPEPAAEVRLLGLAPLFVQRFRDLMGGIKTRNGTLYLYALAGDCVFSVLSTVVIYWVLFRVVRQTIAGLLTIGDVAIYAGAAARLRMLVQETLTRLGELRCSLLHMSNLIAFFNLRPSEAPVARPGPGGGRGEIEIRGLWFTYPGMTQPALSDISLTIRAGETVAIVGENGAGKTTLVKILGRLYDPDQGNILLDGEDILQLPVATLRQEISFVMQDFGHYEASVADNIAFGNWRRMLGRSDRIVEVAQASGVHDMIQALPRGYATRLGLMFGEYTLSGGQWQQLALARAFTREASVLVLDEPTASLDARAEHKIFSRFKMLSNKRTSILISHRFSTVSMADRIVVMDQGRIIETGTHQDLVAQNGPYAKLFALQRQWHPQPAEGAPLVNNRPLPSAQGGASALDRKNR